MRTLSAVALVAILVSCVAQDPIPEGVLGEERAVFFDATFTAVFEARLMVGSQFSVAAVARDAEVRNSVAAGELRSSDDAIVRVVDAAPGAGLVELVGPGEAFLEVHDDGGAIVDRILLRAATSARTELLDGKLLGTSINPRAPSRFAVLQERETELLITATDICGGELFQVDAVEVVSTDETHIEINPVDGVQFFVTGLSSSAQLIVVPRGGGEALATHDVDVVALNDIDDIDLAVAAFEGVEFEVWGRAFSQDVEVIGLDYEWASGSQDVLLSNAEGPTVIAQVRTDAEGNAPADAIVAAEAGLIEDDVDLLTVNQLVAEREPAPDPIVGTVGCACDPDARCDPYELALLGLGLFGLRRLRRKPH